MGYATLHGSAMDDDVQKKSAKQESLTDKSLHFW